MRRRVRLIVPHVRRAALIGKVVDLTTAQAACFAEMLERIAASPFLVDAADRLIHANAAGRVTVTGWRAGHLYVLAGFRRRGNIERRLVDEQRGGSGLVAPVFRCAPDISGSTSAGSTAPVQSSQG
jgi:hypothetical protein